MTFLHIKDELGKSLIKHARLNFERGLRRLQVVFKLCERGERARREINAVAQRQQPRHQHKDRDHAQERPDAQSAGAHRSNFAVGSQTTKSDKNANQHAHWNRVSERDRNGEEKNFGNARQRRAVADDEFEDAAEIAGEKNKSENCRADQGVGDDFSQDVARKDAHPQRLTQVENSTEDGLELGAGLSG